MPMLKLGDFKFQLSDAAYQQLQRKYAWVWAKHPRLGTSPDLHYAGKEAEAIQLSGVVYPLLSSAESLASLLSIADKAEPQLLVAGTGDVLGRWVVKGLSRKDTVFTEEGVPRKIEFTLELERYG